MRRDVLGRSSGLFLLVWLMAAVFGTGSAVLGETWEAIAGTWQINGASGSGSSAGNDPGVVASKSWYADFDFSGQVTIPSGAPAGQLTSVLLRYAGQSESYEVLLDPTRSTASLMENHYGKQCKIASAKSACIVRGSAISFHAVASGSHLTVTLCSQGPVLSTDSMAIPGGRVGLAVYRGQTAFSNLAVSGTPSGDYVFHWHYALPPDLQAQPVWHYLDEVGSSLLTRYPSSFSNKADFESHRNQVVLGLRRNLGLDPWPDRNPLNPLIVGTIDKDAYKIEKVIFESQPGFLVNALVYVPKNVQFPVPGIVCPSGHYFEQDFYIDTEQGRCIGLAKNGYVVLAYDPIGQGERAWLGGHDDLRRKIIVSGMEVSGLMFWDSIRAIDYLCSRPEVDAARIGITGVSGGGFNTLYTALLDSRVKAAAPNGFSSTVESLIKRGNAGCCAYVPNMARYADYGEIYSCLVPRKLLMLGGYTDVLADRMLPTYDKCRRVYRLYGVEPDAAYYLDPAAGHVYSRPERVQMIEYFNTWLKGIDDPDVAEKAQADSELILQPSGLLTVFPAGESRGRSIGELQRDFLARNQVQHPLPTDANGVAAFQTRMRARLAELMGDMAPAAQPVVQSDDKVTSPGSTRHVVLKTERDLPVPLEIHHPTDQTRKNVMIVYFSMAESYPNGSLPRSQMVQRLADIGYTAALPQVRATGSTAPTDMPSVLLYGMALGKHLFSTWIYDLQRSIDFLVAQPEYSTYRLILWGEGMREGMMALYADAVDSRVQTVVATHGLITFQDIVNTPGPVDFDYYLPGILRYADVSQVAAAAAPRRVIVSSPVSMNGAAAADAAVQQAYSWAKSVYQLLGHSAQLSTGAQLDPLAELAK